MKETLRENLEIGKQYYIQCLTEDKDKNYVPALHISKSIGTFLKLEEMEGSNGFKFAFFDNFRELKENNFSGYKVHLNLLWKFYEVRKYKIQNDMEMRACNLILQKITGDQYFMWAS